jgi:hypothetical protein
MTVFPPTAALARQTMLTRRFKLEHDLAVLDYEAVPWR